MANVDTVLDATFTSVAAFLTSLGDLAPLYLIAGAIVVIFGAIAFILNFARNTGR